VPKVYQASYKDSDKNWKINNASQTKILVEARNAAKEYGVRVIVDELEVEKLSFKYFVECMNGRQPTNRKFICAFEPRESVMTENDEGKLVRRWKVKKV
jgi:hypothetical protein